MKNLRNIDLNLLVVFEVIYTTGNVSQAAKQMGVSQPTISNALIRLRATLDDKLFMRSGGGVIPTPKAQQLIVPVREALQIIQIGMAGNAPFDPAHSNHIFGLVLAEPMEMAIMPALINNLPEGSGVSFDYFSPLTQNVEEGLVAGTFELAVFLLPAKTTGLHTEALCPIDLVAVARKDHPRLTAEKTLTKDDIARERHVTLNLTPGKISNSEKVSLLDSLQRQTVCRVSNVGAIARLAGATDLIGMVPRLFAEHAKDVYDLNLFDLPLELNRQQMFMIWHKRHEENSSHIWLRERVREIVANLL